MSNLFWWNQIGIVESELGISKCHPKLFKFESLATFLTASLLSLLKDQTIITDGDSPQLSRASALTNLVTSGCDNGLIGKRKERHKNMAIKNANWMILKPVFYSSIFKAVFLKSVPSFFSSFLDGRGLSMILLLRFTFSSLPPHQRPLRSLLQATN